ncbi:MAG: methyltransferase [Aestuariivirga sp.]
MLSDAMPIDHAAFIRQHTELMPVALVPEIKLHLAHESVPLWQKTEDELGEMGLPPPFWAFAWAGGQALARYVIDNPQIVKSMRVLDLASGSGLVGIAAMKAGAASVLAADIDVFALTAIAMNAKANTCDITSTGADLLNGAPQHFDVILVGDLFYEKQTAARCLTFLQQSSADILIGDPGRSYLPKELLMSVAQYQVPVSRDLEDSEIKNTAVWRLRA